VTVAIEIVKSLIEFVAFVIIITSVLLSAHLVSGIVS